MRVPSNVVAMPKREQAPMPQVPPEYMAMAAASMHAEGKFNVAQAEKPKPKIPTLDEVGMSDDEYNNTFETVLARKGRTDEEFLKTVPEDKEAFAFGGKSDLIMIRKRKKPASKPEDLTS